MNRIALGGARPILVAVMIPTLIGMGGCSNLRLLQFPTVGRGEADSGALDTVVDHVAGEAQAADQMVGPAPSDEAVEPQLHISESERATFESLVARGLDVHHSEHGIVVTLPDSVFEFGSARLTAEALRQVREVAEVLLQRARGRALAVEGHTDSIGAELYNQGLSERRALSVATALAEQGVSEALMTVGGYGSAYPVAPNENADGSDNPEGRRRNRRVEILIEK